MNNKLKSKAKAAILAVFPTVDEYEAFLESEDSGQIMTSIVAFAARMGIVPETRQDLLRDFIENNAGQPADLNFSKTITMETFLANKADFLNTGLSGRGLVARINTLLDKCDISLPKISNTMLTRMKKEPADTVHKQNVLRSLAFWLGYERRSVQGDWNYSTLLKICQKVDRPLNAKEGVRVGVSLVSRGDIIESNIITWLKRDIKQFIKESIGVSPYGQWGKVQVYDITTLYVDFPKEEGIGELSCYQQSIRNAVSVAHQIAIRWALSPFATQKRFIVVGIAAGNFTVLDNYIQPLLNAKLPGDPVIRVSDFARQCILVNDIRAIFNNQSKEVALFNGEHLSIWWIVGLWSSIYWGFIPVLLEDEAILNPTLLKKLLNIDFASSVDAQCQGRANAVTALLRSPQNTLLGIEITKTLYYRNKLWEALEILRIILSINPANLNARALRMMIYRNLGSNAGTYPVALALFKRAEKEADYIVSNCCLLDEDFYDEFAVLKLTRAITLLRFMRKYRGKSPGHDIHFSRPLVCNHLNEAEHLLEVGMSVSPRGTRSLYLLICVRMLKGILAYDEDIYINPEKPISIPMDIARKPVMDMFYAMGYLKETIPVAEQTEKLEMALMKVFQDHNNALALDAYRPTVYFCFAAVLWDFYPVRSVKTAGLTIKMLEKAIELAEKIRKNNLYIYSYTRFHGEMMSPHVFIEHLSEARQKIHAFAAHMEGSGLLNPKEKRDLDRFLLFSHFIDRELKLSKIK